MDHAANGGSHGRSASWGRGGQLPNFSSAFRSIVKGNPNGYAGAGNVNADGFFIPSYLRGSKYVQGLESAHKAKMQSHRENGSAPASQPGSLSTSASSVNISKTPSHRGIANDVIERLPPAEDETPSALPSKWNIHDKHSGLEVLGDGLEVKLSLTKPERESTRDHEACAIRTDHTMPAQCGIYYFEVTILTRKREE